MSLRFGTAWLARDPAVIDAKELCIDADVDLQQVHFRIDRRLAIRHVSVPDGASLEQAKQCWERALKSACCNAYFRSGCVTRPIRVQARDFECVEPPRGPPGRL